MRRYGRSGDSQVGSHDLGKYEYEGGRGRGRGRGQGHRHLWASLKASASAREDSIRIPLNADLLSVKTGIVSRAWKSVRDGLNSISDQWDRDRFIVPSSILAGHPLRRGHPFVEPRLSTTSDRRPRSPMALGIFPFVLWNLEPEAA